jgi:hypothetical protein
VTNLQVANRRFSRLHTVQEVLAMILRNIQFHIACVLRHHRRIEDNPAAIYEDCSLFTLEYCAARVAAFAEAAQQLHTICVDVCDPGCVRRLIPALRVVSGRPFDICRAAVVHSEAPLSNVEMMRTEVSLLPAGMIPVEAE